MSQAPFRVDPNDPRAPSSELWARLTQAERERVAAELPSEFPRCEPPEGDPHRIPKERALDALGEHFRRLGRRLYLSSELPVYYPAERVFAPDVIAVLDVEPHERDRWLVSAEGKGIDLAIEIVVAGSRQKDFADNVGRYARLGIPEYFVFAPKEERLVGYRLSDEGNGPGAGGQYQPILPQGGRWSSRVLGLELAMEGGRLRFFHGSAPLQQSCEIIAHLSRMVNDATLRHEELVQALESARQRAESEAQRAESEAQRAESEAQRAERLAAKLRALGVAPDELK